MENVNDVVIVGGGQAGASAAAKLRMAGYVSNLTIISDEAVLPYQRPPLSKRYLLGDSKKEDLYLRAPSFYEDQNIELVLGKRVSSIDSGKQQVRLDDGKMVSWDRLLLMTGAAPRRLPQKLIKGEPPIFYVRSLSDVDEMAPLFEDGKRVLVVGGGYIGLETAAVARKCGLETTLVEASERILQRVAPKVTSDYFRRLHQENGVSILESTELTCLESLDSGACLATLSTEEQMTVDFIVVGIGVLPNSQLAADADLAVNGGIVVNGYCQTSNPKIYAAGDCAAFYRDNQLTRLESVQNAIEQAEVAAMNILGQTIVYDPTPWFWSDQYDVKLQIAGLNNGFDHMVSRDGVREGALSYWFFKDLKLVAVDAFNDPAAFMCAKKFLEARVSPPENAIKNTDIPLKQLLKELL